MLTTQLKPMDELLSLAVAKTVIISCEGCKEVYFPEVEAAKAQNELLFGGTALAVIATDYICNPDNLESQTKKYMKTISGAGTILVFACGVGTQIIAERFIDKPVFAACDTYPLPGHQGVTPLEYDCVQCDECHLNETGGICPITVCSKSLVNGQCGGAKNGKCEVDKDMECGWERIIKRLMELKGNEYENNRTD
jgi:electron transport complex protein RnfC